MATKFKRGKRIDTTIELQERLEKGEYVYMYKRPKHPSFIINLPLRKLKSLVLIGAFHEAIRRDGTDNDKTLHQMPQPHTPHWLLDRSGSATCQFPGCAETKQYPSEDKSLNEKQRSRTKEGRYV